MGHGKKWTEKDLIYLQDWWGTRPIESIANKLGRSVGAVRLRANTLGLGPYLQAGNYVTLVALMRAVGHTTCEQAVQSWIDKGLAVKHKLVMKRKHRIVYLDDFWEWAEKNRGCIDFSKFEPLAVGKEPDWVKDQRRIDGTKRNNNRRWSIHEELQMRTMIEKGADYDELARALKRSVNAVSTRCRALGIKPEKQPYVRIVWTDEEKEILRKGIRNGETYEIIADRLGRSSTMVMGVVNMLYGTTSRDRIRAML